MKKLYRNIIMVLFGTSFIIMSCSDGIEDRKPSPVTSPESVKAYFPSENDSRPILNMEESECSLVISRKDVESAVTIGITYSSMRADNFIVPENVSFSEGQEKAEIKIKMVDIIPFEFYDIVLDLEDKYVDYYAVVDGTPQFSMSVMQEDFAPYAKGIYESSFFLYKEDDENMEEEISEWEDVLEYSKIKDTYRFNDLWGMGLSFEFKWDGQNEFEFSTDPIETKVVYIEGEGEEEINYGAISANYLDLSYVPAEKTLLFNIEWTISAGSFGDSSDAFVITEIIE